MTQLQTRPIVYKSYVFSNLSGYLAIPIIDARTEMQHSSPSRQYNPDGGRPNLSVCISDRN
jgi:hypothetical protein